MNVLIFAVGYYELLNCTILGLLGSISEQAESKHTNVKQNTLEHVRVQALFKQFAYWVLNVVNSHIELYSRRLHSTFESIEIYWREGSQSHLL